MDIEDDRFDPWKCVVENGNCQLSETENMRISKLALKPSDKTKRRQELLETKTVDDTPLIDVILDDILFKDTDIIRECEKIQDDNEDDEKKMITLCENSENCKVTPGPNKSKHCSWVRY